LDCGCNGGQTGKRNMNKLVKEEWKDIPWKEGTCRRISMEICRR